MRLAAGARCAVRFPELALILGERLVPERCERLCIRTVCARSRLTLQSIGQCLLEAGVVWHVLVVGHSSPLQKERFHAKILRYFSHPIECERNLVGN